MFMTLTINLQWIDSFKHIIEKQSSCESNRDFVFHALRNKYSKHVFSRLNIY
jgi:hypothetical protein